MNKELKITITKKGLSSNQPIAYPDALKILCEAIASVGIHYICTSKHEDKKEVQDIYFDITNQAFSSTLEYMFPDIALRPDLTEEAIMLAEDQLIKQRLLEQENNNGTNTTNPLS